jgi:hypothetical protein
VGEDRHSREPSRERSGRQGRHTTSWRNVRGTEEGGPPSLRKSLDRRRGRGSTIVRPVDARREGLGRVELPSVTHDIVGNELLVALYERSESLPVEPLLGDIADVFQVPVAQARHGKQFVSQRLVRIVEGGLMDLAALRHRPPSSSESFVRVVRRQQEAAPFVEDFQRVPFVVLNASRRNSLLNVCERNAP